MKKRNVRETSVELQLKRRVQSEGGRALKLAPFVAGVPDRIVLLPGGWVAFVEVKAPYGRLSKLQLRWRDILQDLGFRWRVAWDREDVEDIIEEWRTP